MKEEDIRYVLEHPLKKGSGGIGLFNTNRRLRQMFGSGLSIQSREGLGTTVSFEIPVNSSPESSNNVIDFNGNSG
ncbi:hypothetical protein LJK88_24635 [Paenibacillus sp. P26]|nr:hypothetical protein LJK88_24635 [Paenibacillus sp. P26]